MTTHTLMVNQSAMPIGLVPIRDAVSALATSVVDGTGLVQALHVDETCRFRSLTIDLPAPLVVMDSSIESTQARRWTAVSQRELATVSRRVVFARDSYRCQYCGEQARPGRSRYDLTLDHVKPARLFPTRKAATTYDNVVAACFACNQRKGGDWGELPMHAKMWPGMYRGVPYTPKEPTFVQIRFAGKLRGVQLDYVCDYFGADPATL